MDMTTSLGPLELLDGCWVVGDTGKGHWVEFRRDGLYQHEPDSEQLIPWPRIMLGMDLTLGSKYPGRGSYGVGGLLGGLPGPWRGRGSGYLPCVTPTRTGPPASTGTPATIPAPISSSCRH